MQESKDKNVLYSNASAWELLSPSEEKLMNERVANYMKFVGACKTERATLKYLKAEAAKLGFKELPPLGAGKALKPGSKVYFINKNKAIGFAVIGKRPISEGIRMVAAHLDVPRIDVKSNPLYEKHNMALFKTHYYGGIRKYQWVTVPLSLHVNVMSLEGKEISFVIGEKPDDPVFTITDLAPHVAAKLQKPRTSEELIHGEELNLLVGHRTAPGTEEEKQDRVKKMVLEILKKEYKITEEDLSWAEIRVVPAYKPREVGFDRSMIGAYGHDDRVCVYAGFQAIASIDVPEHTAAALMLDKEEVGSTGPNGAQSDLVADFMAMLCEATSGKTDFASIRNAIVNTKVLSIDTNAAIDPSWESAYDPLNSGKIGKGPWVAKFSGKNGKSGSSEVDMEFLGYLRRMFNKENIPYQFGEMGKVEEGGGGTVAYMLANNNMEVVDLCMPTLCLHSPFELVSKVDYHYSVSAYKAFMENSY